MIKDSFVHRLKTLSSYDLTEEKMLRYREIVNRFKPKLIVGYASALYVIAAFLDRNNLGVHIPSGIISGAEALFEDNRKQIEKTFRCKVLNRYGCREVGHVAGECEQQNGLHISAEHVCVEVINERGEPCRSGERGELVVTDLDNYVFPFIRYKVGDIGIYSDRQCPCKRGLPLLEKVEGRIFDIIVGTNGSKVTGTFWTILLRNYVTGIDKFQVIQEKYGEITLRLVTNEKFNEDEKKNLITRVKDKLGQDLKINLVFLSDIPLTASGKHRWVISKVSPFA